ncbi:hypothetical protein V6N12_041083 [Hibiscus sabdariffa]|uniref:SWIM-type domain-containing protein n=1 Tax=Hibiscus sabdariffa TaxID=183260 RepID=A0ABR2E7G2_9ROSI
MSRSDTIFRVSEIPRPLQGYDPTSYRVNLEEKWCGCGYFQALKSPCQHAIAVCNNSRRDYKNLVDPVYFLHSVRKVYEMEFPAIGSFLPVCYSSSRCTVHCHCCFIDLELLPQILKSPRLLRILVGRFVENKALLV